MQKIKNKSQKIKNTVINKDSDRLEKNKDFVRAEGFNTLRSNVRICLKKDERNKILVTSPCVGDGKSTCSCNLAVSFANASKSVLILDCDIRKSVIHKTFNVSNKKGLSDVLSRLAEVDECIQKTSYENLYVLPAGSTVPNPSELLSSKEMQLLIESLEEKYDYLILDSPPINVVSDSVPLFAWVDGVVLVTRCNKTTYNDLNEALNTIKFSNANLFGVFFYDKPMQSRKKYGYSKYSKYSKYSNYSDNGYGYGK